MISAIFSQMLNLLYLGRVYFGKFSGEVLNVDFADWTLDKSLKA